MHGPDLFDERIDQGNDFLIDHKIYDYLGVHRAGDRYVFRTYQPGAIAVELTGDFNSWGGTPMKNIGVGFWEVETDSEVPLEGTCYKYKIYNEDNCELIADPFARYTQWGARDSSIVYIDEYKWNDDEWMKKRKNKTVFAPINIYQLHLGSWRTREGRSYSEGDVYLNYRDIAACLAGYVSDMGYTHICLIGVTEKRKTDNFAPTSRYGQPDGLKYLVDTMHKNNIGVMLEWNITNDVKNEPNETESRETSSSVLYWLHEFHADGLYFLSTPDKEVLETAIKEFPTAVFVFEKNEMLDDCWVSHRKWSEEMLDYAMSDPKYKRFKYSRLNRSLTDGFGKSRILPIKYEDVSKGKQSLVNKMWGDYEEKFARLRLFYSYMMTHPGKKLVFMGCELGETAEWRGEEQLEWFLLEQNANRKFKSFVKSLNWLYKESPELWENDFSWKGFGWIQPLDEQNGVMAFRRLSSSGVMIVALNFTENRERSIEVNGSVFKTHIVLNSDSEEFGGKGRGGVKMSENGLSVSVPPLSAVIVKCDENKNIPFFEKTLDYSSDV